MDDEFHLFWRDYPFKVAKAAAFRAFQKARKTVDMAVIMDGLKKYVANKPDWQAWAHASTWLNGRRWEDHAEQAKPSVTTDWHMVWRLRLKDYKPGGFWHPNWGARPEEGGSPGLCFIPPELLAEWRAANAEK